MGRIRTVKPEFFLHEELYDAEHDSNLPLRLAFIGLWCASDREGRFKWKARSLKSSILPFDDVDFSRVLDVLATRGFLVKYRDNEGKIYGQIPSFLDHQHINGKEQVSKLPSFDECSECQATIDNSTCDPRVSDTSTSCEVNYSGEGKGKERNTEGKGRSSENPKWLSVKSKSKVNEELEEDFERFWKSTSYPKRKPSQDGKAAILKKYLILRRAGTNYEDIADACELFAASNPAGEFTMGLKAFMEKANICQWLEGDVAKGPAPEMTKMQATMQRVSKMYENDEPTINPFSIENL